MSSPAPRPSRPAPVVEEERVAALKLRAQGLTVEQAEELTRPAM